jgi:hypothetical protein
MAYIEVHVDEYLPDASDRALKEEVTRRMGMGEWSVDPHVEPLPWTRRGMADDIRQAYYARDASRLEMLLRQLELRETA